jgi:hypothetical protein
VSEVKTNVKVYNGMSKENVLNKNFVDRNYVRECILSLKIKNSEGWDRIPQRVLVDGIEELLEPITVLMSMIYNQKTVPEQWLVSKTLPVFKNKGLASNIVNYRPVSNLCTASKIFEKLILSE